MKSSTLITLPRRSKVPLLSLLAAVLLILGSGPFFIPFLPFIAIALYVWSVRESKRPFLTAFAIAFPYWFYHSAWILNLHVPGYVRPLLVFGVLLLTSALSLTYALWGWSVSRIRSPIALAVLSPSVWVMWEFWRGELLGDLSYPWSPLGVSLLKSPFLSLAAIGSVYFLSFFVVLVGTLLYLRRWIVAGIVIALALLWGAVYSPGEPVERVKVAVLQPNVLPRLAYDPKEWREVDSAYSQLLNRLKGERVDLVVGSESAFPGVHRFSRGSQRWVKRITEETGAPFLFGTAGVESGKGGLRFYNRALLVDTTGEIVGHYDKVRLVPFGENYPFYEYLPQFIRSINLGQGNYRRGRGFYPVALGDLRLGVMICYESIFPYIGWRLVRNGANLLVVITSDGWFGRSVGPVEHYYLGILRSVETGRSMVRAAKTGISAIVDADGRVLKELPLYRRGVLVGDVPIYGGTTPFVAFGFLIPPLLSLVGFLWYLLGLIGTLWEKYGQK